MNRLTISSILMLIVGFTLAGCASKARDTSKTMATENAVQQAIVNADFRLYAFKGRRTTIPGLTPEQITQAQKTCGTKFMEGTGDVLKTRADREQRRLKFQFASEYNRLMFQACLSRN